MTVYTELIEFHGHPMIKSTHRSTIEVTRDEELTLRGDCIIGVGANRGLTDFAPATKTAIQSGSGCEVVVTLQVEDGEFFSLKAKGSDRLSLRSSTEMVIRKSTYASDRTLAVSANAAAIDIPRKIVESLRSTATKGLMTIEVKT